MLVRIKYEAKSRKLNGKVSSIAELRTKIAELFGAECKDLPIVYKDCDDELVNVIDNEDLENCYTEANELKQTSITFLLKAKSQASRSVSAKKSSSSSSSSTPEKIEAPKQATPAQGKPIDILEAEKQRVIAEAAQHQAWLDAKKAFEMQGANAQRAKSRSKSPSGPNKKAPGAVAPFQQLLQAVKFMKRTCDKSGVENPMLLMKGLVKELKDTECPAFGMNPELMTHILKNSKAEIQKVLLDGYKKAIAAKPELIETSKKNEQDWISFQKRCDEVGEKDAAKEHTESSKAEKEARRAEKLAEKEAKQASKLAEKEAKKATRLAEKEADKATRLAEKEAKRAEKHKDGGRRRSKSRELTQEEKIIKDKVKVLRHNFPRMDKHELKNIVKQNPAMTNEALTETIKIYKRAKSSMKH